MALEFDSTMTFKGCGYEKEDFFIVTYKYGGHNLGDILQIRSDDDSPTPYWTVVFRVQDYQTRIDISCCYAVSWVKKLEVHDGT